MMTFFHVLNFVIPIAFIGFAGFMLDRLCKPNETKQNAE